MQKIILFLHSSRTNLGATQPSAQWVQEGLVLGGEVNRPTRGVGNLPLNSAEIKKAWSYAPVSPIRLHRVDREFFPFDFV